MKNNDLDFIKEKFADSGVNAPEELNEEFVLNCLSDAEPVQLVKKPHFVRNAGIAAAAVALVTAASITVTSIVPNTGFSPPKTLLSSAGFKVPLTQFSNYDEVRDSLDKVIKVNNYFGYGEKDVFYDVAGAISDYYYNSDASNIAFSGNPSEAYHNSTYVQSTGVDEADTVKTDGNFIYCLDDCGARIQIFSAEKEKSKKVGQITIQDDGYMQDFYIYNSKLIALAYRYADSQDFQPATSDSAEDTAVSRNVELTDVSVYDVSDIGNIKLIDSFSQSGSYCSSRMIGGMLYVVSTDTAHQKTHIPFTCNSATPDEAVMSNIPADCIYSVENPTESNFLVVSSINTDSSAQAIKTKAILGSADIVYCNQEYLYVTAQEYPTVYYNNILNYVGNNSDIAFDADPPISEFFGGDFWQFAESNNFASSYRYRQTGTTQIIKISLGENIEFIASNKVDGMVDNQYALDEYEGKLRVATTSTDEDYRTTNNLFVFDENLNQIGEVTGFAPDESIKAVRYIDETAYVITYEETDPLFVIDVSNPVAPKIMGEVKISGFSTLLVPIDSNTLLGIGYHTVDEPDDDISMEIQEGLKIVTFDVSDKSNPKVLDTKIFENYSSEVQYNPKALLVNFERGDFTIPMNYWKLIEDDDNYSDDCEVKNGILNFRVDDGKINIIDDYTSEKFSDELYNINRCVYVDDYIYMLGYHYGTEYYSDSVYDSIYGPSMVIDCVQYK